MKPFGNLLKEARQERGVTLDAIADETRISRRFLEALEASDLETLPGGPFNKGYIRSYAEYLEVDPNPFLDAYDAEARARLSQESDEDMLAELSRLAAQNSARKPRFSNWRGLGLVLTGVSLVLLLVLSWYFLGSPTAPDETSPPTVVTAKPASDSRSANERTEPPRSVESADGSPDDAAAEQPPAPTTVDPEPQQAEPAAELGSDTAPPPEDPSAEEQFPPEEPSNTDADSERRLVVSGHGVGTGVVERTLVGKGDRFPEGSQLWFWTRVVGGESGDILRHYWLYEGRTVRLSELTVGGPHWRTQSNYTIPPGSTGDYVVEARDPDGRVLARQEFQCFPRQNAQVQR
jgi:cytoskeletal protein RodZ